MKKLMRSALIFLPGFFLSVISPAHACTPIVSVAFGALALSYFVWLVLSLVLGFKYSFVRSGLLWWTILVPVGAMWFAVPMLFFLFPAAIVFLAFPMYLAVEFFMALFHRNTPDRGARLVYYGVPTAITLGLGIFFKATFYAQNGGIRRFVWNYFEEGGGLFFLVIILVIGLFVLGQSLVKLALTRKITGT